MTTRLRSRSVARIAVLSASLVTGSALACLCHYGTIKVTKFYDANANGVHDRGEPRLSGWPMTLGSAGSSAKSTKRTGYDGFATWTSLAPRSDYTMREAMPAESNWVQSAPVDSAGNPINPQTGLRVVAGKTKYVKFGNYCTKPSGGRTPGFWGNKNGQAKIFDEIDGANEELALLSSLNLVDANGLAFDPASYPAFRTWLRASNATNMAYKLSAHLAAMQLNIEAGFVNGSRVYVPFGGSINDLVALANQSLRDDPYTPRGHAERAYQEQLKNWLDELNNGAHAVWPKPCARTFPSS
jgi:hypothetical protein